MGFFAQGFVDVLGEGESALEGAAVFDGGAHAGLFGEGDGEAGGEHDDFVFVFVEPGGEFAGGDEFFAEEGFGVGVGMGIDVVGGIDGEEAEAGGGGALDVGFGFEVVGVGADGASVICALGIGFEDAEEGFVHDLLGGAVGAGHFADGLLGEDGFDAPLPPLPPSLMERSESVDVAGGGEAEAVAEAEGGGEAEGDGVEVGKRIWRAAVEGGGVGGDGAGA